MVPVMMVMVMVVPVPTVLAVTAVAMAVAMVMMVMMMVVFLTAGRQFHRRACNLRPLAMVLRGVVLAGVAAAEVSFISN